MFSDKSFFGLLSNTRSVRYFSGKNVEADGFKNFLFPTIFKCSTDNTQLIFLPIELLNVRIPKDFFTIMFQVRIPLRSANWLWLIPSFVIMRLKPHHKECCLVEDIVHTYYKMVRLTRRPNPSKNLKRVFAF